MDCECLPILDLPSTIRGGQVFPVEFTISYCHLHRTAPDLLKAATEGLKLIQRHRFFTHFDDDYFTITMIEDAITKATQGGQP